MTKKCRSASDLELTNLFVNVRYMNWMRRIWEFAQSIDPKQGGKVVEGPERTYGKGP